MERFNEFQRVSHNFIVMHEYIYIYIYILFSGLSALIVEVVRWMRDSRRHGTAADLMASSTSLRLHCLLWPPSHTPRQANQSINQSVNR